MLESRMERPLSKVNFFYGLVEMGHDGPAHLAVSAAASLVGVAVVTQVGPVSRELLNPLPVARVPSYTLAKIGDGIRLILGV